MTTELRVKGNVLIFEDRTADLSVVRPSARAGSRETHLPQRRQCLTVDLQHVDNLQFVKVTSTKQRFSPLPSVPLSVQIAETLRSAIFSDELHQGERLSEADLSQQLGVSRGPVREAFRRLEHEGLLVSVPRRGTFVSQIGPQDLLDVLALREVLDPLAIGQALTATTDLLVDDLREAVDRMTRGGEAESAEEVADAHTAFHGAFYSHSGNRLLGLVWDRLEVSMRLYLLVHQTTFESLTQVAGEHEEFLRLVVANEPNEAVRFALRHIRINMDLLMERVRNYKNA